MIKPGEIGQKERTPQLWDARRVGARSWPSSWQVAVVAWLMATIQQRAMTACGRVEVFDSIFRRVVSGHLTVQSTDSVQKIEGEIMNATALASSLVGPGLTLLSASVILGNRAQFGTFTEGEQTLGMSSGIVLSTGNVNDIEGPNRSPSRTSKFNGSGYAPLEVYVTEGTDLLDAAVLEIQFQCTSGLAQNFIFNYSFASEEYNEYVNDEYNDIFAFFLNGETQPDNIATLGNGTAVAINSVNCGNPYNASAGGYCDLFVNNEFDASNPAPFDIQFDGFTKPLQARAVALAGTNVMRIAIADAGDDQFDSAIFIQAGSLTCVEAPTDAPASAPNKGPTKKPTGKRPTRKPTVKQPTKKPTKPVKRPTFPSLGTGCGVGTAVSGGGGASYTPAWRCLQRVKRTCGCSPLCCYGKWTCPNSVITNSCPELRKARPDPVWFNEAQREISRKFRSWCDCGDHRRSLAESGGNRAHEDLSASLDTLWIPEEDIPLEPPDL